MTTTHVMSSTLPNPFCAALIHRLWASLPATRKLQDLFLQTRMTAKTVTLQSARRFHAK